MSVPDVLAVTWADLLCLCELPGGGARELQPASLRGQGCDREAESAPLSARSCRSLPGLRSLCPRLSAGLDREGSLSRLHVGPRGVALGLHPRRQIWGSGCQRSPELWRVAGPGWSCASPEWAASCLGLQLSQAWRGPRGPRTSVQHTAHTASFACGALSGPTAHLLLLLPLCGRRTVGRGSGPSLEQAALPTAPPRRQGRAQEPGA